MPNPKPSPPKSSKKTKEEKKYILDHYLFALVSLVLITCYWLVTYYLYSRHTIDPNQVLEFSVSRDVVLPVVSLFMFTIAVSILGLFFKRFLIPMIVFAVISILFLFIFGFNFVYLAVLILTYLVFILSYFRMRRQKKLLIKVAADKILKVGLPLLMTFVVLLTTLVFFYGFKPKAEQVSFTLPRVAYDQITPFIESSIQRRVPAFSYNTTVDELLGEYVLTELMGEGGPEILDEEGNVIELDEGAGGTDVILPDIPGFEGLDNIDGLEETIKGETARQINESLLVSLGIEVEEGERVVDFLYRFINIQIDKYLIPVKPILPYITAVLYFFWLKLLSVFVVWLTYPLMMLILNILESLKVVEVKEVDGKIEKINF